MILFLFSRQWVCFAEDSEDKRWSAIHAEGSIVTANNETNLLVSDLPLPKPIWSISQN